MTLEQDFGSYLRGERESRQIPLEEIASVTKISMRSLQHLEAGRWSDLPGDVFVSGFVRSYSKHVGVEESGVGRYRDVVVERDRLHELEQIEEVGEDANKSRNRFGVALFVIILVIIATITLSLLWRGDSNSADVQASSSPTVETVKALQA
jgi:cytoskeleton protein RodZ